MKKTIAVIMGTLFLLHGGIGLAGTPKGLEKKEKAQKGFSQGEKSGWEGETPKGWENFSDAEKEQWRERHQHDKSDSGKHKELKNKNKEGGEDMDKPKKKKEKQGKQKKEKD